MESRRAETLEALSAYLQHQRTLLARTHADIERLKKLKTEALVSPQQLVNLQETGASTSQLLKTEEKISELQDYHPAQSFPTNISWEAFSSSDPTPLRTLAIRTRIDHTQQTVPLTTQRSPLSLLQKFVKDARKVILDPVLENLSTSADTIAFSNPTVTSNLHINPPSLNDPNHIPTLTLSSHPQLDNEEHRQEPVVLKSTAMHKRERAHARIRELKKRKIKTDLVPACDPGGDDSIGIFVRNDIEDESAEVDISMGTPQPCAAVLLDDTLEQIDDCMDVDSTGTDTHEDVMQHNTKLPESPASHHPVVSRRDIFNHSSRTRKPSLKLQFQSLTPVTEVENEPTAAPVSSKGHGKRSRDITEFNDTVCKLKSEPLSVSEVNGETEKNRPDTYKQAWSISEQHLLERLLEEIPDGERNRWAKISQAMGGRRTPRQVASRVQKYFEKLKRFGVGVDNKGQAKS